MRIRLLPIDHRRQVSVWTEERTGRHALCRLPRQGPQALPGASHRLERYRTAIDSPTQHRFIETSIGSLAANVSAKIAGAFGYSNIADTAKTLASNYIGDYLHTF